MGRFLHHPDGRIHINSASLTLEEFKEEYPEYKVENGYIGQEYVQGQFHRVFNDKKEEFLSKVWPEGNTYIARYAHFKQVEKDRKERQGQEREQKYQEDLERSRQQAEEINRVKEAAAQALLDEIDNKKQEQLRKDQEFENDPERIAEQQAYEQWKAKQKAKMNPED